MTQSKMMSSRELSAYLMEARQDLTVRDRAVYDTQGREVARIRRTTECCANCRLCQRMEMWGVVRHVCGDPSQCTCVDVAPDGWCEYY